MSCILIIITSHTIYFVYPKRFLDKNKHIMLALHVMLFISVLTVQILHNVGNLTDAREGTVICYLFEGKSRPWPDDQPPHP